MNVSRGGKRKVVSAEPAEGLWQLPEDWRWERLGDVADINPKTDISSLPSDQKLVFLPMVAVAEESGVVSALATRRAADIAKGFTRFRSGDVLFAKITPCMENGKVAVVPDLPGEVGAGSTEFHVVRCTELDPRFLFHFLVQRAFRQEARRNMSGSAGQLRVPTEYLRLHPVPVPPCDVQRRIVARIDALFAEIGEGEEALKAASEGLKTYHRSLLKAAVTGELTADWRRANPTTETGEELVRSILAERRAVWDADRKNRAKKYAKPDDPSVDNLPRLPENWCWASMDQLLWGIDAGLNVKALGRPPNAGEFGIVKISAVTWDEFDENESKTLSSDLTPDPRHVICAGDLLFSRANTLELVGAPAIVRTITSKLLLSDKVLRLCLRDDLKEWTYFFLKSPYGRREIESRSTGNQLSMRNIPQEGIRAIPIPVPPRTELQALVGLLRAGWSANSDLDVTLASNGSASALRQSILAAAFRGELVN